MELNEAIKHARDVAENRTDLCEECRAEHRQLAEWLEKLKELTEENETLYQSYTNLERKCASLNDEHRRIKADTVRKMRSEIADRCIKGGIYPAFVARTIDNVAKEILEDS